MVILPRTDLRFGSHACAASISFNSSEVNTKFPHVRDTVRKHPMQTDSIVPSLATRWSNLGPYGIDFISPYCALPVLFASAQRSGGYLSVFPGPGNCGHIVTVQPAHERTIRDAKLESFAFYCWRHTFGTRCAESGMDRFSLARLMGHECCIPSLNGTSLNGVWDARFNIFSPANEGDQTQLGERWRTANLAMQILSHAQVAT